MGESPEEPIVPEPEELLRLGEPKYNAVEVSKITGLELDTAKRLWRAMGFVVIPDEDLYFTDGDVAVLRKLVAFMNEGFAGIDLIVGITRTMSQSVARLAEAETNAIRERLAESSELLNKVLESRGEVARDALDSLEEFLVYVWRRQMAGALQRDDVLLPEGPVVELAVGFADLVGFTQLSREISETELSGVIDRFEGAAQEAATEVGARIVKTIGDEVMFVSDDPAAAAETALSLIASIEDDAKIDLRIGMATGQLTSHHGDYFGPSVNLASRAGRAAKPGTILVSQEMASALEDDARYDAKRIPRQRLKGIGTVQLFALRRANPT